MKQAALSQIGASANQIAALLGGPHYATVFAAVRRRLEEAGMQAGMQVGMQGARAVTLRSLTAQERQAIADLHGWTRVPAEGPVRIKFAQLDAALRQSRLHVGLIDVVQALGGPLGDRRQDRQVQQAAVDSLWEWAEAHDVVRGRARPLLAWLATLRRHGLLLRAAHAAQTTPRSLLEVALGAVARLPADRVALPVLAAQVSGDAHALDTGQPLASLVLRAAACLVGLPQLPTTAVERRHLWAAVGVLCDALSSHVLVLGLHPAGPERLARHLREACAAGEPVRITLRELHTVGLGGEPGGGEHSPTAVFEVPWQPHLPLPGYPADIFVCENPGIVAAAADTLGARCRPLVCVEGVPSTAAMALLHALRGAGCTVRFHADFDWAGLRIGNLLARALTANPWRYDAAAYREAALHLSGGAWLPLPPADDPTTADWDPALTLAMRETRVAIYEEQVVSALLRDLDSGPAPMTAVQEQDAQGEPVDGPSVTVSK